MSKDTRSIFNNWYKYQELVELSEATRWEKFLSFLGKAGSMDKLYAKFSKRKRGELDAAKKYVDSLFSDTSNKFLQGLKAEIDRSKDDKPFPNQTSRDKFGDVLIGFRAMYDSLVAAAKLPAEDENSIPVEFANETIVKLRQLVDAYAKDIDGVRKYTNEANVIQYLELREHYDREFGNTKQYSFEEWLNDNPVARYRLVEDLLIEQEQQEQLLNEFFAPKGKDVTKDFERQELLDRAMNDDPEALRILGQIAKEDGKKVANDLKAIKQLRSKVLPTILSLLGGSFTAAHFIAMSMGLDQPEILKTVVTTTTTIPGAEGFVGDSVEIIASKKGMLVSMGDAAGGLDSSIAGPAKTFGQWTAQLDKVASTTGQSVEHVLGELTFLRDPENGPKLMQYMYEMGQTNPGGSMSDIVRQGTPSPEFIEFIKSGSANPDPQFADFINQAGSGAGTAKGGMTEILGINAGKAMVAAKVIAPILAKVVVTQATGYAIAGVLPAAIVGSGALLMIGVPLMVAGLAIYAARYKGLKSSRIQKMNDLRNSMELIDDDARPDPVDPVDPVDPEEGDCFEKADKLWNSLKVGDILRYKEVSWTGANLPEDSPGMQSHLREVTYAIITDKGEEPIKQIQNEYSRWPEDERPESEKSEEEPGFTDQDKEFFDSEDDVARLQAADDQVELNEDYILNEEMITRFDAGTDVDEPWNSHNNPTQDRVNEGVTHKVFVSARTYPVRWAQKWGRIGVTPPTFLPIFRDEGRGEGCRSYVEVVSKEELEKGLAEMEIVAVQTRQEMLRKKLEDTDEYLKPWLTYHKNNARGVRYTKFYKILADRIKKDDLLNRITEIYVSEAPEDATVKQADQLNEEEQLTLDLKEVQPIDTNDKPKGPTSVKSPELRAVNFVNWFMNGAAKSMERYFDKFGAKVKERHLRAIKFQRGNVMAGFRNKSSKLNTPEAKAEVMNLLISSGLVAKSGEKKIAFDPDYEKKKAMSRVKPDEIYKYTKTKGASAVVKIVGEKQGKLFALFLKGAADGGQPQFGGGAKSINPERLGDKYESEQQLFNSLNNKDAKPPAEKDKTLTENRKKKVIRVRKLLKSLKA